MSKSKKTKFKLSTKAQARLHKYLTEISKGITNVCEMHTYDESPSMKQEAFEMAYIDKLLGRTASAVSASIKTLSEALTTQKEAALGISQETKQEDNKE